MALAKQLSLMIMDISFIAAKDHTGKMIDLSGVNTMKDDWSGEVEDLQVSAHEMPRLNKLIAANKLVKEICVINKRN